MSSIDLQLVFADLPELATLHIQNIDSFSKETYELVCARMSTYKGLENLALELVPFDLEENKEYLLNVL